MSVEKYRGLLDTPQSRRSALKLGIGAGIGVVGALFTSGLRRKYESTSSELLQEQYDAKFDLRSIEYDYGSSEVRFEDVTSVFPSIARVYDAYIGTDIFLPENRPEIFVIRDRVDDGRVRRAMVEAHQASNEEEMDGFSAIQQMMRDYPERKFTLAEKKAVLRGVAQRQAVAWVSGNSVFFNLEPINNEERDSYMQCGDEMCVREARPFEYLRSLTFHEIAHFDRLDNRYLSVSSKVRDAFLQTIHYDLRRESTEVKAVGFRINVKDPFVHTGNKRDGDTYGGFEEFYAEYLNYQISKNAEFSHVLNYDVQYSISDYRKFEEVLYQCGMSLEELAAYHRQGDIEGFCLAIANGSGREFKDEYEKLVYGLKSFFTRMWMMRIGNWDRLSEDFPGIKSVRE